MIKSLNLKGWNKRIVWKECDKCEQITVCCAVCFRNTLLREQRRGCLTMPWLRSTWSGMLGMIVNVQAHYSKEFLPSELCRFSYMKPFQQKAVIIPCSILICSKVREMSMWLQRLQGNLQWRVCFWWHFHSSSLCIWPLRLLLSKKNPTLNRSHKGQLVWDQWKLIGPHACWLMRAKRSGVSNLPALHWPTKAELSVTNSSQMLVKQRSTRSCDLDQRVWDAWLHPSLWEWRALKGSGFLWVPKFSRVWSSSSRLKVFVSNSRNSTRTKLTWNQQHLIANHLLKATW